MMRHALAALLLAAAGAHAQARPMVAPEARVYGDIDRLAAAGLIDTLLVGARPFTEREVVRLLDEARRKLERATTPNAWAQRTIDRDLARFARTSPRAIDAIAIEDVTLDSPDRGVPDMPAGVIDARIQPLVAYRGGRELLDGSTQSLESQHSALLGSHFALSVNPRVALREPNGAAPAGADLRLQSGSLAMLLGNVYVDVGKSYAVYGQAPTGGLLLSTNAPALEMVRVSTDAPFTLPWWFGLLGPMRGSMFLADLGANHQIHPHSKLVAYRLSALPHPRFEIGVGLEDAMGGAGGDPASFGDRFEDLFLIFDLVSSKRNFQFSNKLAGGDFHWRMPEWAGFELYGEVALDDFDGRRLKSVFLDDGGYLVGTSLSCLATCGRLGVRAEYHQTGIRYYTHSSYPLASDATLLGDPLGPRGLGGYVTVDGAVKDEARLGLQAAFEVRSGNSYAAVTRTERQTDFHFERIATAPGEKRARLLATWTSEMQGGRMNLRAALGGERVTNFAFVGGADRTNWLANLGLELRP